MNLSILISVTPYFNIIIISVLILLRICAIVVFYYRPYQKTKTPPPQPSKPVSTAPHSTIQSGTQCTDPSKYNYETNLCATCNGTWTSAIDALTDKPITLCQNATQQNVPVTFAPSTTPSGENCVDKSDFFVSNYDGYPNVCVKCLSGTAFNTNTNKCVKYDSNGSVMNSDDTNIIKTYYSASPSTILIPTESKPSSKLTEIPSILHSVFVFSILNTVLFVLPKSKYTLLILLTLCLIELVLNVNLYYICSSDKYNSNFKNDEYSISYNIAMNVLSLLCIIYLLYTTMDNDDDSKEKVHHKTKQNTEEEYENTDLQQSTQDILQQKIKLFTAQQKLQHAKNIAELENAKIQKHSKKCSFNVYFCERKNGPQCMPQNRT